MVELAALPALSPALIADLTSSAVLDGVEIRGVDISGTSAANARLLEFSLRECSADDLATPGVSAVDTFVGDMRVQTWKAHNGSWRDATFAGLRVGAWLADGTEFIDVTIRDCKVDLLSLRGARLTRVTIVDCRIDSLDLTGAEVSQLAVAGGNVGELVTSDATMTNVDVSATDLQMVSEPAHLRGLVVSAQQLTDLAPVFAEHMGILVAEDN